MYYIFDGESRVMVAQNQVTVGGFTEPLKMIIRGSGEAYVIGDNAEISTDQLLWSNRLKLDFESLMDHVVYVKPNPDRNVKMTIKVEEV
jgi:hypothetical protein